jgi:hypothetical protein
MLKYLKQDSIPNKDFIISRIRGEACNIFNPVTNNDGDHLLSEQQKYFYIYTTFVLNCLQIYHQNCPEQGRP